MKFNNLNTHRFVQVIIACILCLASSRALARPQAAANPEFAAIDAYVTARMEELRIPGPAIGIVKDDQILYLRGFGIANPSGQPVTPQTPFRLASVSKTITALAIMQLVEAGKIELDARCSAICHGFGWQMGQAPQSRGPRLLLCAIC